MLLVLLVLLARQANGRDGAADEKGRRGRVGGSCSRRPGTEARRAQVREANVIVVTALTLHNVTHVRQIDHYLDHLDLICCRYELCRICILQLQPRKRVPDHAGHTAPTRQHYSHERHRTDQESICLGRSTS